MVTPDSRRFHEFCTIQLLGVDGPVPGGPPHGDPGPTGEPDNLHRLAPGEMIRMQYTPLYLPPKPGPYTLVIEFHPTPSSDFV